MAIDVRRARRTLAAAGARGQAVLAAAWPFGRERRLRALLRRRLAILEAKNRAIDLLFRMQKPLGDLRLFTLDHVARALEDPERRKLVIGMSASRSVIDEEITARSGGEIGLALDRALSELIAEGVLIRVPGKMVMCGQDVFLAVQCTPRPHYDVSALSRLVHEGRSYGSDQRSRARKEASTTGGRSYQL